MPTPLGEPFLLTFASNLVLDNSAHFPPFVLLQMYHGRRDGSGYVFSSTCTCLSYLLARSLTQSVPFVPFETGKTLQCIALLHTLLLQSSIAGRSTMEKGIIVCPSSLVKNWGNELGESIPLRCGRVRSLRADLSAFVQSNGSDLVSLLLSRSMGREEERSSFLR